ncbi:MAG: DUF1573 domain-containing protein [Chitinophagaceae bacterium]|nr:DUF1573 domain-containing protein [Chitinophagaceae bacterium]
MKKILLPATIGFFLLSCNPRNSDKVVNDSQQQTAEAIKENTTVEIIDSLYNFGSVAEGEKVEYSFRFKNSGKNPLVITKTTASCGCTVPEKPEKPIMPGETGFIKVVFDSNGKLGHNTKSITVASNAYPPFNDLILEGEVTEKK